jgi:hypothetical protein
MARARAEWEREKKRMMQEADERVERTRREAEERGAEDNKATREKIER